MKKFLAAILGLSVAAGSLYAQMVPHKSSVAPRKRVPVTRRSLLNPASLNEKAPAVYKVKFTTTKGVFVVQVTRAWAPLGADRLYNLVKYGFFTDASFFRVIPGFMVQFGINAKPAVNAAWQPATISDDPVIQSNKRGYLSFATGGPNTRTTQVFINFADNSRLDSTGFSPFGQVIEGMEVVDMLYSGYGEGAPNGSGPEQGRIQAEGKAYLDKAFPKLESIKSAVILRAVPVRKSPAHSAASSPKSRSKKTSAKKEN
jgi:peptidyl-prolyl cis-trans isomerase A (cyclophilin A)